jgi:hypothetical protein
MKLGAIYDLAVQVGREADPRGRERIELELAQEKKHFDGLTDKQKELYDAERLSNPYHDTRIVNGSPDSEIRSILVGIDMEVGELVLADRLREKRTLDLVLTHHPEGRALARFFDVMWMQTDILHAMGVPVAQAEGVLRGRIKQVANRMHPVNHTRAADAARLLALPFLCVHTPSDNLVTRFLADRFEEKKPDRVGDIMELLMDIPEYRHFAAVGAAPELVAGTEKSRCGGVMVDMTGGTEGAKEAFEKLSRTEVGTIVGMHMSEENLKEAEKNNINVIIAGHMSSDTIGINLFLDAVDRVDPVEVIETSGFVRIRRI